MSLTMHPADVRSDGATIQPLAATRPSDPAAGLPSVERWLEAMYGIRSGTRSRRTSVPMTFRHAPAVADWLHRMLGL